MSKYTDIRLRESHSDTEYIRYRAPMKFGGRVVTDVVLLNVSVDVETRDRRRARGCGSMTMGNVWGWPSNQVSTEQTLAAMVALGQQIAHAAGQYQGIGHPLEITHELAQGYQTAADAISSAAGGETGTGSERVRRRAAESDSSEVPVPVSPPALVEPMPRLAQLVAASPTEAAIHDAYGKALGANSYNLLGPEHVNADLSAYLGPQFAGEHLDRYTLRRPKPTMPLYHLVGALDPLTDADIPARINDGLPETLPEWIAADGLTHLKIKLNGDDLAWDVERVASIERVAAEAQRARGCMQWCYSADFNERCANVEYVLDFLARVGERSPAALQRLQYIEQPTHRDLRANPENRMHRAARIKPVVIDESLVDFESLLLSRELGYSGVALKACKGHSEALLMGAAAQKFGMFLCVQDLTCPGASFLHSASLSARIPTVAAIEGNARQYCPGGNRGWADRFPGMFRVTDGTLGTAALDGPGLGF
jgi:L-alanine-DL-glutamate epimerase-like enolase superfamily enzyme